MTVTEALAKDFSECRAATPFWLLLGGGLDQDRITAELVGGFERVLGDRSAVVRTSELVLGVSDGRLTLRDLRGTPVAPPELAYARLSTPRLSTDREITLLRHLEAMGTVLLNPIDAVLACVNKFWHLQQLAVAGLPVPDTLSYVDASMTDVLRAGVPEPCVVKSVRGHRGRRVFLARDTAMLHDIQGSLNEDAPYLFQEYVRYSHGRDLRVVVVGGKAVAAQVRVAADGGLKSNLALGGTSTPCTGLHPAGEALAVAAAEVLGLGVAGVDLLFEPDGSFTICEVNANVGWREHLHQIVPAIAEACDARLRSGR
ncbi:RimK family alpha-L-glutamate ligase [Streptomyces sp. ASQP_92]|uniref:RimK family alpha-L-glutamate ligase n=1 Tax=unclassified Streptomyces TaxID=2593676 RepID=UPI0021BEF338|nr:RimK family alpha-L-glutamate ligase [Streptomyces sp. ASQP_92]MCT9089902.1 RimK family alpha-L-glutamate ligase [Streptomyces sp. ASQP_92]